MIKKQKSFKKRKKIGVMGGTFDPIHNGHLVAASEVAARFQLKEVIFVPTGLSWHKSDRMITSSEHRYLMTVIATASNPRFSTSRVDIDRKSLTYTQDTLIDLRSKNPNTDFVFITGADAISEIASWKNANQLWELAQFVGVTRPGYDFPDIGIYNKNITYLEIPALSISSTDCRNRIRASIPIWYLVPDGVVQYIQKHNLYKNRERIY